MVGGTPVHMSKHPTFVRLVKSCFLSQSTIVSAGVLSGEDVALSPEKGGKQPVKRVERAEWNSK